MLPFTKTPANLAVRTYEYSPLSSIKLIEPIVSKFKGVKSKKEISEIIDDLGKTFTGTGLAILGYMLYKNGVITGGYSEDPDEAAFQKQQGYMPYAVKAGNTYYTYDWAVPSAGSLLIGSTIAEGLDTSKDSLEIAKDALVSTGNTMFDLSPLTSLQDILGGYGTPTENILNTVAEFPQRLVPSALGQTARATDTTQRSTYSKNDMLKTNLDTIKSKIPGVSKTLPANYDTWGREVKRSDDGLQAVLSQFISPGTIGNANISEIDSEISKLYEETGSNIVFPKKAERSIKVDGQMVDLDNEKYSKYQKSMGEKSYYMAKTLVKSENYSSLDATQKSEILETVYGLSNMIAKAEISDYKIPSNSAKLYYIYKDGGSESVIDYLTLKQMAGTTKKSDILSTVDSTKMSKSEKGYYIGELLPELSKGALKAKEKYGDAGVYEFYNIDKNADANKNGSSSMEELKEYFKKSNYSYQEQKNYFGYLTGKEYSKN